MTEQKWHSTSYDGQHLLQSFPVVYIVAGLSGNQSRLYKTNYQ